ncbi:hypothetical protein [Dasania marina]|uniref:hypothetical protein n=1 Tax=Dasania marina TaxID=471499 RepID=UPI00037C9371|nr:hypothetical protein [Dasania marina]|tara:strand:- start:102065 stop:102940 length:876 start_codon:yes stop_codon:yes gene_type:complete
MTDTDHPLSTSALAKALAMSSQQLFGSLNDYGWIKRVEDSWELTSKGEFEGGEYVHSKKYGRYIVWPHKITQHPLLQAMEDNRTISAKALGEKHQLSAREVNRALAELGWIKHSPQGWELTRIGEQKGGLQFENEQSGTFYVLWPEAIQTDKQLSQQLQYFGEVNNDKAQPVGEDLFAAASDYPALDGHNHSSKPLLKICHWLYTAGFAHACNRRLPCEQEFTADFYLPKHHIYIEFWGAADSGHALAEKMQRKGQYAALGLSVVELEPKDIPHLDAVLTKALRKLGVRVY